MVGSDPVVIDALGELSLEDYCAQIGVSPSMIDTYTEYLPAWIHQWTIRVFEPDDLNPHGRLGFSHPIFDDDIVVISSTEHPTGVFYDVATVHRPGNVDYHHGKLDFESALAAAIEVAAEKRYRDSRFLPPHEPVERLEAAIYDAVSRLT